MATKQKATKTVTRKRRSAPTALEAPAREVTPDEFPEDTAEALVEQYEALGGLEAEAAIPRIPIPFPILLRASGTYVWSWSPVRVPLPVQPTPRRVPAHVEATTPAPTLGIEAEPEVEGADVERAGLLPIWFPREELRLDVDGMYPQMVVSGTLYSGFTRRIHWIANLRSTSQDRFAGHIWYKDGDAAWLPHTNVTVQVQRSWYSSQRSATVRFTGGGAPDRVRTYRWDSASFRTVEFEYDWVQGTSALTRIDTGDHPNRPASMRTGLLSLETVYRRAGATVRVSPYGGPIPLAGARANQKWSDAEMHDAMQIYWSRFANRPKWALWVLFASLHERGTSLGGIMFDSIGPNHRQGTALFNDSFISNPPATDPAPDAWVRRMKFWTAAHEMGHAFNLAHSWQKAMVYQGNGPWIPLANEPEARSFMNYPYNVTGGESAFFADFDFRFSDGELLFMRHAPERFVQMGNAEWFDDHGFEQAESKSGSPYRLELRTHRSLPYFEFLEPVILEMKLSNDSADPIIVNENVLETPGLTVIVKKRGQPARLWRPFAEYCFNGEKKVLMPGHMPDGTGEAVYAPLKLTGGVDGWQLSEPGYYTVQIALRIGDEDVVSNAFDVRVAPPKGFEDELLAQDFFNEDVARVLTFSGSRFLEGANEVLREVVDRMGDSRAALHAQVALATPSMTTYKLLTADEGARTPTAEPEAGLGIALGKIKAAEARSTLEATLIEKRDDAADTFGHIGYERCVHAYGDFLAAEVDPTAASKSVLQAEKTLEERGVIEHVLDAMKKRAKSYKKK